ncbi:hypothetical protein AUP68_07516 [Ilyonectria robusta]
MSLKLSRLNAMRVILAVRSRKKGEAARASIEAASNRKNVVEVWQVDMSDYHSIQDFVAKCDSLDRLDVIVANAGVLRNTYEELEGTEITIKVNIIGTFLLVVDILPMLRRSREKTGQMARLVITSSIMHEDGVAGTILTVAKALMARTTEVGGRTLVHSTAAGEESHGQYMSGCRVKEPRAFVRSKEGVEVQERVHKELKGILETIEPGITNKI